MSMTDTKGTLARMEAEQERLKAEEKAQLKEMLRQPQAQDIDYEDAQELLERLEP